MIDMARCVFTVANGDNTGEVSWPSTGHYRHNFDDLAFLFDTEAPNILGRLAMFQQEVAATL